MPHTPVSTVGKSRCLANPFTPPVSSDPARFYMYNAALMVYHSATNVLGFNLVLHGQVKMPLLALLACWMSKTGQEVMHRSSEL